MPELTEDFTADPVELFFDLAYVFAFSQLVGRLIADPSWGGVGRAALLFGLLWLPWSQFTWSANAVSGNGRTVRILFLVATAASVPMAASMSTAFESGGPVFTVALGVIVVIGVATMRLAVEPGTAVHASMVQWASANAVILAVLLGGAFVDGGARVVIWVIGLAMVIAAMAGAGRGEWIIRTGHFAERHALIVIIALGEVIVAIGIPVVQSLEAGDGLGGSTVVALVAAAAFAGLLWWAYFDRPGPALEHRAEAVEGQRDRGRFVRDVYSWAHAPIVAGIILSAAALEQITVHPDDALPPSFRAMLFGGLALTVVGVSAAVWRSFRAVARERIAAVGALGVLLAMAGSWNGTALLVAVDATIFLTLIVEHQRIER